MRNVVGVMLIVVGIFPIGLGSIVVVLGVLSIFDLHGGFLAAPLIVGGGMAPLLFGLFLVRKGMALTKRAVAKQTEGVSTR